MKCLSKFKKIKKNKRNKIKINKSQINWNSEKKEETHVANPTVHTYSGQLLRWRWQWRRRRWSYVSGNKWRSPRRWGGIWSQGANPRRLAVVPPCRKFNGSKKMIGIVSSGEETAERLDRKLRERERLLNKKYIKGSGETLK